jgi:GTP cyclohydrolase II
MPLASVTKVADADFPTRWGHFRILGFEGLTTPGEPNRQPVESALALVMGDISAAADKSAAADGKPSAPIVRIHSQCTTGDVFHSLRCDCHDQLHMALARIAEEGAGILIYEQQEGRGIGLMAKLKAYELQDQGLDTIEANLELGFQADCRNFELPAAILQQLGVPAVRLLTNNPEKVEALRAAGISVVERLSAEIPVEPTFERYLETKRDKMGHLVG